MNQVKICPSCGLENPITEMMCGRCMFDISSINPIDKDATIQKSEPENDSSATIIESKKILRLDTEDGARSLFIESGNILGREACESEFFLNKRTVSRKHAKFTFSDKWTVEDLNSTNGTWVNERRLEDGEKCPVKAGDKIAISRSCVLIVR